MKLSQLLVSAASVALFSSLFGCGDDEPRVMTRGAATGGSTNTASQPQASSAPSADAIDESLLPEELRGLDWSSKNDEPRSQVGRDPFLPYVSDLIAALNHDDSADNTDENAPPPKGRLINFDVEELQLIAIITGSVVNEAMLTDPSGLGHIIKVGEIIGRVPMRVARVTRNEVLFRPLQPTSSTENAEIRKTLLTQEELEEQLP